MFNWLRIEVCFQMTEAQYLDLRSSHWVPADWRQMIRHQVMTTMLSKSVAPTLAANRKPLRPMPPKTGNCNSTLIPTLPRIQNLPLRPNSLRCLGGLTCLIPTIVPPTPLACSFGRCPGSQGFFFTLREASGCGGCFAREVISVPALLHIHVQKMLSKMLFHAISLYFIELCSLCPFSFFIFGDPYWSSRNWVLPCELVRPPVADPSKSLLGFDVSPRKHPNCHIFSSEKI